MNVSMTTEEALQAFQDVTKVGISNKKVMDIYTQWADNYEEVIFV